MEYPLEPKNKLDKQNLWNIFKAKYYEITGNKIEYEINDIEKFAESCIRNNNFKEEVNMYIDFSITWLATNIMELINKIITNINTTEGIESMDVKSQFVVFDRLIKQLKDLVSIRNKMSELMNTNKNKDKDEDKINIDRNRLLL